MGRKNNFPPPNKRAKGENGKPLPYSWKKRSDAERRAKSLRVKGYNAAVVPTGSWQREHWTILAPRKRRK